MKKTNSKKKESSSGSKKEESSSGSKKEESCWGPKVEYKCNNPLKGILYGIVPHIGCILFIVAAVLGSTVLMKFFKPLLLNKNIFYYLILISVGFAGISSFFYLRRNNSLSWKGIKNKKGYLTIMFGTTVGINLLLFFVIFPMTANVGMKGISAEGLPSIIMEVDIPCAGHAPLISSELSTIEGVVKTDYSFPNNFQVYYEEEITGEEEILSLSVFEEYPATLKWKNY